VQLSLADRAIVIIGGTSGLGLSAARACAAAGARLVVVGRDEPSTNDAGLELGSAAIAMTADATKPETAPAAIARAIEAFGGFHGLYHVAGGSGRRAGDGPLHEITDDGWQFTLDLNLTSLFYSNRAAIRQYMARGGGGVVLNMGSVLASSPSPRYFATHAYTAAKSAVVGFTRSCAAFYASQGIRFNVIAPGLIETPMSRRACSDDKIRQFVEAKQPIDGGRIGQPADLDAAVVYLLSDASRFVTGQVLSVDGGWSVSDGCIELQGPHQD
jgi:NAD(P)-dependent dehydrogenase (short-subunit alcohol dehydrogenase family)